METYFNKLVSINYKYVILSCICNIFGLTKLHNWSYIFLVFKNVIICIQSNEMEINKKYKKIIISLI